MLRSTQRLRPHLLLGVDSELTNTGSLYAVSSRRPGLELEQCSLLMEYLGWTYEFVHYRNNIGYISENGTIVGMLGDVYHGRIDMVCGRFRMTSERLKYLRFAYPINYSVKQVYLIRKPLIRQDINFMIMPFTMNLWILLGVTVVLITLMLLLIRRVEFVSQGESIKTTCKRALHHMVSFSTSFTITTEPLPTYKTFWVVVTIWMLAWTHVFVAYYTSALRGMLVVSTKRKLPFEDFHGFIKCLEDGSYQLIRPSPAWRPECPGSYTTASCAELFDRIFEKHPPITASVSQLINDDFMRKQSKPLVAVEWYEHDRMDSKFTLWTRLSFHSDIWVISDFTVSPASFVVAQHFKYKSQLDSAIVHLLPAFKEIRAHYSPTYPEMTLIQTPTTSAFNLVQLNIVFSIHAAILVFATLVLIGELLFDRIKKAKNMEKEMVTLVEFSAFVTEQSRQLETCS